MDITPFMIVATPHLKELTGFFDKTVIVVFPQEDGSHVGYIINKCPRHEVTGVPGDRRMWDMLSGPVGFDSYNPVAFITTADWDRPVVAPGTCLMRVPNDMDAIEAMIVTNEYDQCPSKCYVLHGYADWGQGQLENEMYERFNWLRMDIKPENIFTDDIEGLWERLVREHGYDPGEYDKVEDPSFTIVRVLEINLN